MPICKASSLFKPKVYWGHLKMGFHRSRTEDLAHINAVSQSRWITRMSRSITRRRLGSGAFLNGKIPILASPRAYFRCG
jgi:hypothetical protein